jgi:hypothetical protein
MRVLVFRSGRHLHTALRRLDDLYPGAEVTVVTQPGTERLLDEIGAPPERRLFYRGAPRFTPSTFLRSGLAGRVWADRFDLVAVLWADPEGREFSNVNRTALVASPSGFVAVTPDGSLLPQRTASLILRELRRAVRSIATLAVIGLLALAPAAVLRILGVGRSPLPRGSSDAGSGGPGTGPPASPGQR